MSETRIRILHIEDNPDDAHLLHEWLGEPHIRQGREVVSYELVHVTRLKEAQALLAKERFHLILCDLSLPDSQGLETVRRICSATPEIPMIVMSGYNDEALAIQAMQKGAQDYLVKGHVNSYWLVRAIRYALERHRLMAELQALSLTDSMTGLYNRRGFLTLAAQHMKLARRTEKGLILVYADLDQLKQINDTFGHQEGDRAIIQVAEILQKTFRHSDILARLSGDEFAVLAIDSVAGGTRAISARLEQHLAECNLGQRCPYKLSLSFGIVHFPPKSKLSLEEMMRKADETMYTHKRSKRALSKR
jgi:diguanylate cyclase (GGDEF)-like protein